MRISVDPRDPGFRDHGRLQMPITILLNGEPQTWVITADDDYGEVVRYTNGPVGAGWKTEHLYGRVEIVMPEWVRQQLVRP